MGEKDKGSDEGKKEFELFSSSKRRLGGVLIPVGASLEELNIQWDKEQWGSCGWEEVGGEWR